VSNDDDDDDDDSKDNDAEGDNDDIYITPQGDNFRGTSTVQQPGSVNFVTCIQSSSELFYLLDRKRNEMELDRGNIWIRLCGLIL